MRVEVFVFIACAFVGIAGLFLPAGELRVPDASVVQPRSISLFQLSRSKEAVRAQLYGFRASATKKVGAKVLGKVAPHLRGRAGANAADVNAAVEALDSIRDEDLETVGTIANAAVWTLIVLNVLVGALIAGLDPRTGRGRGRAIAALIGALLIAALAIAIHLVLRRVVAEANAEIGLELFSLRAGAYLIPAAAAAAPLAIVALLVAYARAGRVLSRPAA